MQNKKGVINYYTMRNPNRLDAFYEEVKRIHKESFPDLRFGQLMYNIFSWLANNNLKDPFYMEEDEFLSHLKEFEDEIKNNH